jgi:hypothetical protein
VRVCGWVFRCSCGNWRRTAVCDCVEGPVLFVTGRSSPCGGMEVYRWLAQVPLNEFTLRVGRT